MSEEEEEDEEEEQQVDMETERERASSTTQTANTTGKATTGALLSVCCLAWRCMTGDDACRCDVPCPDLLVYASKSDLFLLDASLQGQQPRHGHVHVRSHHICKGADLVSMHVFCICVYDPVLDHIPVAVSSTLTSYRSLDRLIYIHCIPSLSLLLCASSASHTLVLYRVMRYACGRHRLVQQQSVPVKYNNVPIQGRDVYELHHVSWHGFVPGAL